MKPAAGCGEGETTGVEDMAKTKNRPRKRVDGSGPYGKKSELILGSSFAYRFSSRRAAPVLAARPAYHS